MNWFNKKKKERMKKFKEDVETLKNFRDIGEKFEYLDVSCIVTDHVNHSFYEDVPMLKFNYCDRNRVIRSGSFSVELLTMLIKQEGK